MEISINANIACSDGPGGRATRVTIHPACERITNLVINMPGMPPVERLVAVNWVREATPGLIRLGCTCDDLACAPLFTRVEWMWTGPGHYGPLLDEYPVHKLSIRPDFSLIKRVNLPPDEVAVRRGMRVAYANGCVGRVEGLQVDPAHWHINHLVLRTGYLWDQKVVSVPLSQIKQIGGNSLAAEKKAHRFIAARWS
jgi:hypothetical protein